MKLSYCGKQHRNMKRKRYCLFILHCVDKRKYTSLSALHKNLYLDMSLYFNININMFCIQTKQIIYFFKKLRINGNKWLSSVYLLRVILSIITACASIFGEVKLPVKAPTSFRVHKSRTFAERSTGNPISLHFTVIWSSLLSPRLSKTTACEPPERGPAKTSNSQGTRGGGAFRLVRL